MTVQRKRYKVRKLSRLQRKRCYYCRQLMVVDHTIPPTLPNGRTIDHKVPLSKGGSNGLDNVVLACLACNRRKADLSVEEFVGPSMRAATQRKPLFCMPAARASEP